MHDASAELRFEYAARLRDEIKDLKRELREVGVTEPTIVRTRAGFARCVAVRRRRCILLAVYVALSFAIEPGRLPRHRHRCQGRHPRRRWTQRGTAGPASATGPRSSIPRRRSTRSTAR